MISGDVHWAEFLVDDCTKHIHGYPLREFVSSGLTHGHGVIPLFGGIIDAWSQITTPYTFNMALNFKKTYPAKFLENNFGTMDFFIDDENPENDLVKWAIRDHKGFEVYTKVFESDDFT